MKKIGNKFSIIGTNPNKYFENYCLYINFHNLGVVFEIKNKQQVIFNDEVIFECNSPTTLRQNIDLWEAFGFVIRINKYKILKIVDYSNREKLFEFAKGALLQEHIKESINKHRNTILLKILQMSDENFIRNNDIYANTTIVTWEKIKKEIGEFEKMTFEDEVFIDLVKSLWGDRNE